MYIQNKLNGRQKASKQTNEKIGFIHCIDLKGKSQPVLFKWQTWATTPLPAKKKEKGKKKNERKEGKKNNNKDTERKLKTPVAKEGKGYNHKIIILYAIVH